MLQDKLRACKIMAEEVKEKKGIKRVCVTGAGGYIGSWVAKLLLSNGYIVHGTVRELGDEKYAHLTKLEKASENLKLFKADLLDYGSLRSAISGCNGVLHVASPVPFSVSNPQVELIEPAVKGTLNVLKACVENNVDRVVVVSSVAAVFHNPGWNSEIMDENCWSDMEYMKTNKRWYAASKTEAESEALEYAKTSGLDVVTLCPTYVWGPILQSTMNFSSLLLLNFMKGGETLTNEVKTVVDVRDVAAAILVAYEKPEAEGRYICSSFHIKGQEVVDKLKTLYPNYKYPKNIIEMEYKCKLSSEKLQSLGWSYRPLEETIVDSVESYRKAGLLAEN